MELLRKWLATSKHRVNHIFHAVDEFVKRARDHGLFLEADYDEWTTSSKPSHSRDENSAE